MEPLAAAAAAPDPVYDSEGKVVRTGIDCYVLHVIRGRGGGLTHATTRNKTCQLDVVQEQLEVSDGLPLRFSPDISKKGVVRTSTDLNVNFSAATMCTQSKVWRLDNYDDSRAQWFVTTGGVQGNP